MWSHIRFLPGCVLSTSIVSACCRHFVPPSPSFRMQVFFFFSVDYRSVFCCRIHHSLQTLSLHSCPLINDQGIKHIACKCHLPLLLCVCAYKYIYLCVCACTHAFVCVWCVCVCAGIHVLHWFMHATHLSVTHTNYLWWILKLPTFIQTAKERGSVHANEHAHGHAYLQTHLQMECV